MPTSGSPGVKLRPRPSTTTNTRHSLTLAFTRNAGKALAEAAKDKESDAENKPPPLIATEFGVAAKGTTTALTRRLSLQGLTSAKPKPPTGIGLGTPPKATARMPRSSSTPVKNVLKAVEESSSSESLPVKDAPKSRVLRSPNFKLPSLKPKAPLPSALPKLKPKISTGPPPQPAAAKGESPVRLGKKRRISEDGNTSSTLATPPSLRPPSASKRPLSPIPRRAARSSTTASTVRRGATASPNTPIRKPGTTTSPTQSGLPKASTSGSPPKKIVRSSPSGASIQANLNTSTSTRPSSTSGTRPTSVSSRASFSTSMTRGRVSATPPQTPSRLRPPGLAPSTPARSTQPTLVPVVELPPEESSSQNLAPTTTPSPRKSRRPPASPASESDFSDMDAANVSYLLETVVSPSKDTPFLPRLSQGNSNLLRPVPLPLRTPQKSEDGSTSGGPPSQSQLSYFSPENVTIRLPTGNERGSILSWEQFADVSAGDFDSLLAQAPVFTPLASRQPNDRAVSFMSVVSDFSDAPWPPSGAESPRTSVSGLQSISQVMLGTPSPAGRSMPLPSDDSDDDAMDVDATATIRSPAIAAVNVLRMQLESLEAQLGISEAAASRVPALEEQLAQLEHEREGEGRVLEEERVRIAELQREVRRCGVAASARDARAAWMCVREQLAAERERVRGDSEVLKVLLAGLEGTAAELRAHNEL